MEENVYQSISRTVIVVSVLGSSMFKKTAKKVSLRSFCSMVRFESVQCIICDIVTLSNNFNTMGEIKTFSSYTKIDFVVLCQKSTTHSPIFFIHSATVVICYVMDSWQYTAFAILLGAVNSMEYFL